MSQFEILYLILLRTNAVVDILVFFSSVQIAAFVGIYFIRDIGDRLLRHAIAVFYFLATIISIVKINMDMALIGSYVTALGKLATDTSLVFSASINFTTFLFFIYSFNILYGLLALATFYLLYFYKFED